MNILSPVAVPAFFAISGFLFFMKERNSSDLWKYVWRVIKLYLIWTVIFLPLTLHGYFKKGMLNVNAILDYLQRFFFDGSYYHLWFLPSLIVAIIVAFYISKMVSNRTLVILSVILFVIGTLVDTYSFLSPILKWSEYKTVFLTTRNGLFFGFPFVVIGKIIAKKQYKPKLSLLIISVILTLIEGIYLAFVLDKSIVNMSLSSIIVVPTILIFVLNASNPQIDGSIFRKASTLIFCAHPIAISFVGHFVKGYIGTIIVLLVTIIAAFGVIEASKKFKLLTNLW